MKKRIMVIEDDESLRNLGERVLLKAGYSVLVKPDTEKGIPFAGIFQPDLIIIDHELGTEKTGLMFAEIAKAAGFKVVMFTASDVKAQAKKLGIKVYLKPYLITDIVEEVLGGKQKG